MIEVETPQEIEVISNGIDVEARSLDVEVVDLKELDVTVAKKEFVITGDDIYVPKLYDDAPQWMKDLVQIVVNSAVETNNMALISEINSTLSQFAASYVPLNQYTQSILDLSNEDARINTVIETLNSNYNDGLSQANAQILNLENTKASKDEVVAQIVTTLSAQLANPTSDLGATIGRIDQTIVNNQEANALSMEVLTASLESVSGEIVANAEVVNNVLAYVGIDEAGASTNTGLSAYLEGSDGNFGSAGSKLNNDIKVTAESIESKWAYNSSLNINGVNYNSGFGLATNLTNSSIPVGQSEFWITADKFKITNATNNRYQPFTINGNSIVFNGKVTFGGTQVGTIDEAIAAVVQTVAVGDKNINITDNLIPMTSLVADTDNSGYQFISTPTKSNAAGIDTYAEAQIVLDGSDEVYSPYVDDMTISYYYRFGIKGITSGNVFKIVTINSSNVATSSTVTITMDSGQSITAGNWYIIEGMINPTGGSTAAVGSIRNSSGIKIGTVSSFVMPSGTSKLVLGWVASCTISRAKLCKVTADTVTSDLTTVNGQLATLQTNIDNVSWSSLQGKDLMAQQLGYTNYNALVSAASTGTTLINGGYINTELIQTNAITANKINTAGLIAENISADEIVGKTLTGAVINGARINGAVVKASYLDLDGELEVLTNYHISTAMYNANPSLYSDAVYISADGEYRIPSISTVKENDRSSTTKNNTIYGSIRSYNTANAGNNNKAVKIRPYFIISNDVILFSCTGTLGDGYYANKGCNISLGSISLLMIMFNANSLILTVNGTSYSLDSATNGHSKSVTITIYGFVFQVNAGEVHSGGLYGFASSFVNVTLKQNSGFFLGTDFNSTSNGFKIQDTTSHAGDTSVNCSLSSAISVNNMI